MPRNRDGAVGERAKDVERTHKLRHAAAREVGAPGGAGEQRVAGENRLFAAQQEAHASRRVPRRLQNLDSAAQLLLRAFAEREDVAWFAGRRVVGRVGIERVAEHREVSAVDAHREAGMRLLQERYRADVVEVPVRQENRRRLQRPRRKRLFYPLPLRAGIDDPRFAAAPQYRAVGAVASRRECQSFHVRRCWLCQSWSCSGS